MNAICFISFCKIFDHVCHLCALMFKTDYTVQSEAANIEYLACNQLGSHTDLISASNHIIELPMQLLVNESEACRNVTYQCHLSQRYTTQNRFGLLENEVLSERNVYDNLVTKTTVLSLKH